MNALSPFSRPSPYTYGEDRDNRTEIEKLSDAVDRHIANVERRNRLTAVEGGSRYTPEADRAIDDADASEAELVCLVEEATGIGADRLIIALRECSPPRAPVAS